MDPGLNTECGILGFFSHNKTNLFKNHIIGLQSIQHRGQESCGISFYHNDNIITISDVGLVKNIFSENDVNMLYKNYGNINSIIGHVRYSTSGKKKFNKNYIQPICSRLKNNKSYSIAFNGNIPLIHKVYSDIEVDTHGLIKFIKDSSNYMKENLIKLQNMIPGVFCILILVDNEIYILRDRYGVRPLSIGTLEGIYCVSSETDTMNILGYKTLRDINPGEILKFGQNSIETIYRLDERFIKMHCLFEYIYFLRPTSESDGTLASNFREKCGKQLVWNDKEFIKMLDRNNTVVVGCPNSGICAGKAYADEADLPYRQVINKNDQGRTFILGNQEDRINALKTKYKFQAENIKNKIIIIVDDSVVRGNTLKILLQQINNLAPREIHIRVASPPVISQCYYGIDIPTKDELIYYKLNNETNMTCYYNVNSFKYLSIEDTVKHIEGTTCKSCFTGKYNKELLDW